MKAIVKKVNEDFQKYTVTITIETAEESTHFHDNVMGKIPMNRIKSSPFYAAIFNADKGDFSEENVDI